MPPIITNITAIRPDTRIMALRMFRTVVGSWSFVSLQPAASITDWGAPWDINCSQLSSAKTGMDISVVKPRRLIIVIVNVLMNLWTIYLL